MVIYKWNKQKQKRNEFKGGFMNYTKEELEEALRAITSTISKCEKIQPKLKKGTSQHTLLVRRIKAFYIATSLINKELEKLQ